jgi:hypothetical protein
MGQRILNTVIATASAHGLSTGILVKISNVSSGINGQNYYVKVLSSNRFSLYADSSLTLPLGVNSTLITSTASIIPLNQSSITYSFFPPNWTAITWIISWINSSTALTWKNAVSSITWKNTI